MVGLFVSHVGRHQESWQGTVVLQLIPTGSKAGSGGRGGQRVHRPRDSTSWTWPVLQEPGNVVLMVLLAVKAAPLVMLWVSCVSGARGTSQFIMLVQGNE